MTDWPAEIAKQKRQAERLAGEVPIALQSEQLDLEAATELFQELDKQARACEQILLTMRNTAAPQAEIAEAEAVCNQLDALVRAAAERMMALRAKH